MAFKAHVAGVALRALLGLAGTVACLSADAQPPSPAFVVQNPDWEIAISEFGYSDLLFDRRPGFDGREYLSGEWGAAVRYTRGSLGVLPTWLEPVFVFPDWQTNSNFAVTAPVSITGLNSDGFQIFTSTIANPDLEIRQTYQMRDSLTGIAQGWTPASELGLGNALTSNRYVLQQTYSITNRTQEPITNLNLFQLLHGFQSERALYDNRDYGGPFGAYRYDITQRGTSLTLQDLDVLPLGMIIANQDPGGLPFTLNGEVLLQDSFFGGLGGINVNMIDFVTQNLTADLPTVTANLLAAHPSMPAFASANPAIFANIVQTIVDGDVLLQHDDVIAFHSQQQPTGFEVGAYGLESVDDHITGRPSTGVHLSVESGTLANNDNFVPAQLWVAGAQLFDLGTLLPNQSVSFDVLLSIATVTTVVPLPSALLLLGSALGLFGWLGRRRQTPALCAA